MVECSRVENVYLRPVDSCPDITDAEIDAADPGQHPGFIGRIEAAVVIYDDVVGGEEVRIAYVDVVVGIEAEHALQALAEVVFLHKAPGSVIAGDQQVDEFAMKPAPAREGIATLLNLSCEPLVVYRAQVDGPDSVALVVIQQRLEVRRVGDIHGRQRRNLPRRVARNGVLEISIEGVGDFVVVRALPFMRCSVTIERCADEGVGGVEECP